MLLDVEGWDTLPIDDVDGDPTRSSPTSGAANLVALRFASRRSARGALADMAAAVAAGLLDLRAFAEVRVSVRGRTLTRTDLPLTSAQRSERELLATCAMAGVSAGYGPHDVGQPLLGHIPAGAVELAAHCLRGGQVVVVLDLTDPHVCLVAELVRPHAPSILWTDLPDGYGNVLRSALALTFD